MKINKMVIIGAFSLSAIFSSSALAEQLDSTLLEDGSLNNKHGKHKVYRLTDAEKREIEEQSIQLHLQEMKAGPQKGDNPFGAGSKE